MFPFMFAWVQQCKIVIQTMSHSSLGVGGTAFVGRVTFVCSIPVTYVSGMTAFNIRTSRGIFMLFYSYQKLHIKLLWVVVGVATEEFSPQLVRNEKP